jgi:hypothetical protein
LRPGGDGEKEKNEQSGHVIYRNGI